MADEQRFYRLGHVKRNPDSGDVAIRTIFPEDQGENLASIAWLVATKSTGAKNATTEMVDGWDDLYEPPAPQPIVD